MGRTTKTISLSIPPEMAKKIKVLMKEEGRTRSVFISGLNFWGKPRKILWLVKGIDRGA